MPDQSSALTASIAALSQILVNDSTVAETLRRVADLAKETISGSDMVSVAVLVDGRPQTGAFTDVTASTIDDIQYRAGIGPCLVALGCQQPPLVDSTDNDERWPPFADAAAAHGVLSSLSMPLVVRGAAIGAINCYSRQSAAFSLDTQRIGSEFAAVAAVTVANSHAYWEAFHQSESLGRAMQSRATIEQAKGILIAEQHCDAERAFEMLVRASQRENRKLREISDQIVKRWASYRDRADSSSGLSVGPDQSGPAVTHSPPVRRFGPQDLKEEQMQNTPACDEEKVLELRVQGKSFTGIAKTIGLSRPSQANDAFNRALRRKSPAERDALRRRELIRLDALADGVRAHPERGPDGVARRLRTVARLRAMLMSD